MQINLGSGDSLTAVQAGAVTTTAPTAKVDYIDGASPRTAMASLAGVTSVTLLAGQSNGVRTVTGLSILNGDTVTQTVTVNHTQNGTAFPVVIMTLLAGETLVIGSNGINVLDSSGNIKLAFASSATTFTGDVTISGGKNLIFSGTTGQCEIEVVDNLADALSVKITGGADLLHVDTSTGAVVINVGATVRWNVLGSAQIGNATADLVAFHGSTPTDQCPAYTQTFSTADRTHAARTATALTDNSAGSANTTIQALADGTTYANDVAAIRNNFADLAAAVNAIIVDLADTAGVVNAIVDDLQEKGLAG